MARLYANENFPLPVVEELRLLGHDILTSYESGRSNQAIPDEEVLAFALNEKRTLLTLNRKHFIQFTAKRLNTRASSYALLMPTSERWHSVSTQKSVRNPAF